MEDPARDVPPGIIKSVVATALLYGIPVLGILVVLPTDQTTGLAGFPDALKQALTVFGGNRGDRRRRHRDLHPDRVQHAATGWAMGILVVLVAFTSGPT